MSGPVRKLVWRKLASDPTPEWQQLPILTRGVADEIMRRLDPENGIDCSDGVDPHEAVCMVTGAHPRERRRVREAIDELVRGRWLVLHGRRWLAFFPDLGKTRPSSERATPGRDGAATEQRRSNPLTTQTPTDEINSANTHETHTDSTLRREEKRREEESRGEETRAPEGPVESRSRVVEALRREADRAFRATGRKPPPWFGHLDSPGWHELAKWLGEYPNPMLAAAKLGENFALDAKAEGEGWPPWFVVGRTGTPGKYLASSAAPSSFDHVDPTVDPASLLESA